MSAKWSGWECLGGVLTSAPAVASWGANRLDVFVSGTDNGIWHKWYDGTKWRGFEPLAGLSASGPGAMGRAPNLIDVFVEGPDNAVMQKSFNGTSWGSWNAISPAGTFVDAPSACLFNTDLFVAGRGVNNLPVYLYYDTSWHGPLLLPSGTAFFSAPAIVSWGTNRLDIFMRGTDNALWQWFYDGTIHAPLSLGGTLVDSPGASTWGTGRLDVFARGSDNHLYHKWWDSSMGGTWSAWENLGGNIISGPAAVSWGPNRIDVFARGVDNQLWHKWWG
jgi:Repeat of unknown function (DUF346)